MGYRLVVLIKEVPDTKRITGQAMKEDGTVNRAALPAILNPEDLNALEMALEIKDRYGGRITVLTMGRGSATNVLKEALYRGADEVALLSDRKFAVADTLATSYTLMRAIEKRTPDYDLVLCGRQAIDGDTAQVGPQVAEKLGIPQVTYAERVEALEERNIRIRRRIGEGYERVTARLPLLVTVVSSANKPRPPRAKLILKYRNAGSRLDLEALRSRFPECADESELEAHLEARGLLIPVWGPEEIDAEPDRIGATGSPTRVKKVDSVVFKATASKQVEATETALRELVAEWVEDHTVG